MNRNATLILLDHLCNVARNAVHASFGLMDCCPAGGDPAWRTCVDAARTSGDKLLCVLDDIRELLADPPAASGVAEEFDFPLCVGETVELLNLAFAGRGSRLVLEASGPLVVRRDRPALEQVLTRILKAALELARHGVVRVAVGACEPDGVRMNIKPPHSDLAVRLADWLNADLERLEFPQGDQAGWIVPLLVAGRRMRALGGTAELGCEPDAPTGLVLFLPRNSQRAEDAYHPHDAAPNALSILVAEDCDENFALTAVLLQSESVRRARTGLEAIDLVKERRFDVVLMDIHMPGMDGYQAIRAIREWETCTSNARTPIVVFSADDLATQAREAAQAGCSGFLRKPVRKAQLLDLLERLRGVRTLVA